MDLLTELKQENKFLTISIAYLGTKFVDELDAELNDDINVVRFDKVSSLQAHLKVQPMFSAPDILLLEVEDNLSEIQSFVLDVKNNPVTRAVSIVLLAFKNNKPELTKALAAHVNDIYFYPFNVQNIQERLKFILKFKLLGNNPGIARAHVDKREYKIPAMKRAFDIIVSGMMLLLLSPFMLVVALLIKLDSKGPIFYKSKRAGTGYRIFDFYKFRSMKANADKELAKLASLNQYTTSTGENSAFIKIKDDPRITRLGALLRNTSIDELPQLFNVLKGDMSLVGNRPLPLYEAQQLTSDEWAMRFLAPAGITGLWQVTKRGRSDMSDEERRMLDNDYAGDFSFWMDLKVLLKTIPALLQKEKV